MVGESSGGHVWLERLTDDANLWLTAVRMEEQGELAKAALLYLEDATKCLDESTVVRAALGGTCAADCFAKLGLRGRARRLYHVAGMLYWDNADARMGASVRESLWSLQEALRVPPPRGGGREREARPPALHVLGEKSQPVHRCKGRLPIAHESRPRRRALRPRAARKRRGRSQRTSRRRSTTS